MLDEVGFEGLEGARLWLIPVAHGLGRSDPDRGVGRQLVCLVEIEQLDAVLEVAQPPVGLDQVGGVVGMHVAALTQRAEPVDGGRYPQRGVEPPVD